MDIIFGTVVMTSVLLVAMAMMALFARLPVARGGEGRAVAHRAMVTSIVVYFMALLDLLLIAQQTSLALGTFVVGLVTLVVLYVEPSLRPARAEQPVEGSEWER